MTEARYHGNPTPYASICAIFVRSDHRDKAFTNPVELMTACSYDFHGITNQREIFQNVPNVGNQLTVQEVTQP